MMKITTAESCAMLSGCQVLCLLRDFWLIPLTAGKVACHCYPFLCPKPGPQKVKKIVQQPLSLERSQDSNPSLPPQTMYAWNTVAFNYNQIKLHISSKCLISRVEWLLLKKY